MKRVLVAGATGYFVRALARSARKLEPSREVAELAFGVLAKPVRITHVPVWPMKTAVATARVFSRHQGELLAFFTMAMTRDAVAPRTGTHRLRRHFEGLARGT